MASLSHLSHECPHSLIILRSGNCLFGKHVFSGSFDQRMGLGVPSHSTNKSVEKKLLNGSSLGTCYFPQFLHFFWMVITSLLKSFLSLQVFQFWALSFRRDSLLATPFPYLEIPKIYNMYKKDLLKDWFGPHLTKCGWYLDCPKDCTPFSEVSLRESFEPRFTK